MVGMGPKENSKSVPWKLGGSMCKRAAWASWAMNDGLGLPGCICSSDAVTFSVKLLWQEDGNHVNHGNREEVLEKGFARPHPSDGQQITVPCLGSLRWRAQGRPKSQRLILPLNLAPEVVPVVRHAWTEEAGMLELVGLLRFGKGRGYVRRGNAPRSTNMNSTAFASSTTGCN